MSAPPPAPDRLNRARLALVFFLALTGVGAAAAALQAWRTTAVALLALFVLVAFILELLRSAVQSGRNR